MKVNMLLDGKPFMTEFGIVGYSSVVLIQTEDGNNILYDCESKGCAIYCQKKEVPQMSRILNYAGYPLRLAQAEVRPRKTIPKENLLPFVYRNLIISFMYFLGFGI